MGASYGTSDSVQISAGGTHTYNWDGTPFSYTVPGNWSIGYDAAGNLRGYTLVVYDDSGGVAYRSTYSYDYRKGDSYQEITSTVSSVGGSSAAPGYGSTSHSYNVDGELVQYTDNQDNSKNRYFANDQSGQVLTMSRGQYDGQSGRLTGVQALNRDSTAERWGYKDASLGANDKAQIYIHANGQLIGNLENKGNSTGMTPHFDVNYSPVSSSYPSSVPPTIIVQEGDTLRTVAARVYGDASLWYVIAEENGFTDPDAKLPTGTELKIPNNVVSLKNTSSVYKPFSVQDAIGDTTPTQPAPQASGDNDGCGVLGTIIVIIVAVVVSVLSYGAGTGWAASLGTSIAGEGTAGAVVGGAIAGAAGSIVSQEVGIAIGAQDSFSWKGVALGAIAGGVTAGVSEFASNTGVFDALGEYGSKAAIAATDSVLTQGIGVLTGLQNSFNWREVAISAVEAPVSAYAGGQVSNSLRSGFGGQFAADITGSLVRRALGGKVDTTTILVDAFGNAIGNSIVEKATPQTTGSATSKRGGSNAITSDDVLEEVQVTATRRELDVNPTNTIRAGSDLDPDSVRLLQAAIAREEQQNNTQWTLPDIILGEPSYGALASDNGVVQTYALPDQPIVGPGVDLPPLTAGQQEIDPMYLLSRAGQGAVGTAKAMVTEPFLQSRDLLYAGASFLYNEAVTPFTGGEKWFPEMVSGTARAYDNGASQTRLLLQSNPVTGVGVASFDLTTSAMNGQWGDAAEQVGGLATGFAAGKLIGTYGDRALQMPLTLDLQPGTAMYSGIPLKPQSLFALEAGSTFGEITTPWGSAVQSSSTGALAARPMVENGATLYRLGTIGKSEAAEAQFWALEHPFSPGYAERYGIPAENVAKFNFIETATLKPGTPFVTRPAPGIGSNGGGGIEVVVPKNGVTMKYFGQ